MFKYIVALLVAQVVTCYVMREIVTEHKDHPDQCYDSVNQLYYDLQTSWNRPGLCEQLRCTPDTEQGQLTITHHGCGVVIVEPPCELRPGNLSLLYPDCCFSVYCPPAAPTPKRL